MELEDGSRIKAKVVVGADGVMSKVSHCTAHAIVTVMSPFRSGGR